MKRIISLILVCMLMICLPVSSSAEYDTSSGKYIVTADIDENDTIDILCKVTSKSGVGGAMFKLVYEAEGQDYIEFDSVTEYYGEDGYVIVANDNHDDSVMINAVYQKGDYPRTEAFFVVTFKCVNPAPAGALQLKSACDEVINSEGESLAHPNAHCRVVAAAVNGEYDTDVPEINTETDTSTVTDSDSTTDTSTVTDPDSTTDTSTVTDPDSMTDTSTVTDSDSMTDTSTVRENYGAAETPDPDTNTDKETPDPDTNTDKETPDPDTNTDKETPDPDTNTDKETPDPDTNTDKETPDPDTNTDKETPDPDTNTDKETPDPEMYMYGDVNMDGKITARDSLLVQRYSISLTKFDDTQVMLADVSEDGRVTAADSLAILRYSISLPTKSITGRRVAADITHL